MNPPDHNYGPNARRCTRCGEVSCFAVIRQDGRNSATDFRPVPTSPCCGAELKSARAQMEDGT